MNEDDGVTKVVVHLRDGSTRTMDFGMNPRIESEYMTFAEIRSALDFDYGHDLIWTRETNPPTSLAEAADRIRRSILFERRGI